MKSLLLGLLFFVSTASSFAQSHYIFRGSQRLKATTPWDFQVENFQEGLKVQVAKTAQGGVIMLTAQTMFQGTGIRGSIFLYLENGSTIKCLDRGVRDMTNGNSKVLYSLTSAEMDLLASNRISQIRFVIGSSNGSSSMDGAYIADNKTTEVSFGEIPTSQETSFHTEEEIAELLD